MDNVGYKKPPAATQFAKGKSGNPKGRPKGSKNLRTVLEEELSAKITVQENGKKLRLNKRGVIVRSLANKAMTGDIKAAQTLLNLNIKVDPDHATVAQDKPLEEHELALLDAFIKRQRR
jgi:hypothetical protein